MASERSIAMMNEDKRDVAKEVRRWARQSGNLRRRQAMLELLKTFPGMSVRPDFFDRDPWLLNCQNGTLDLKVGRLRPHSREDYITKILPLDYDEKAGCPLWLNFLEKTFAVESDIIPFIQRVLGYSLSGDMSEQCFFIFCGEGANGKSTLLETVRFTLGSYAKKAAPEAFFEKRNDSPAGYEIAALEGARFVISDETQENRRLDEGIIKRITGGDTVSCRHMRQDFYEYAPTYKIFLATNHAPTIKGNDTGIWRRVRMIPFTNQISDESRDPYLKEKLKLEAPGILSWMVRGCLEWQERKGLFPPPEIITATEDFRAEQDVLGDFINDRCKVGVDEFVDKNQLYKSYAEWCAGNEQSPMSLTNFTRKMKSKGYQTHRTTDGCGKTFVKILGISLSYYR
jgi:putative DNA primase/helicase